MKKTEIIHKIIVVVLVVVGIGLFFFKGEIDQLLEVPEIRKIIPPLLGDSFLGKRILCHRPMRRMSPNMSVLKVGDHIIAHNYGHGGSGWTLAPGSAQYVNSMLESFPGASDLKKDTPITIIGAGVIGLFSAYDLINRGYTNITIVAEKFQEIPSYNAGGLVAPVSMDNDPSLQKIVDQIGIEAYVFYKGISEGKNPNIPQGASLVPTYFRTKKESGLEPYVKEGVMRPSKKVILDFGTGKTQKMVAYDDGIFVDTGLLMDALKKFLQTKVKFIKKKINNFNEIETKYIINCSGLGSKELNRDQDLVSVQGHLIMLKDQNPKDLHYMILVYFGKDKTKSGLNIERSFYIFPKRLPGSLPQDVGVIGGTFIEGGTKDVPNTEEFDIMIQGARDFYGIK